MTTQYPQQGSPSPAQYSQFPPAKTNGLAIAALVLGIVWVWWIGSILAVIFGHIALRQIDQRGEQGRGMAVAGLVLGWVGVATLLFFTVMGFIGAASGPGG